MRAYRAIIERYIKEFGDGPVEQVSPEHILTFLNRLTEGNKPYLETINGLPLALPSDHQKQPLTNVRTFDLFYIVSQLATIR